MVNRCSKKNTSDCHSDHASSVSVSSSISHHPDCHCGRCKHHGYAGHGGKTSTSHHPECQCGCNRYYSQPHGGRYSGGYCRNYTQHLYYDPYDRRYNADAVYNNSNQCCKTRCNDYGRRSYGPVGCSSCH